MVNNDPLANRGHCVSVTYHFHLLREAGLRAHPVLTEDTLSCQSSGRKGLHSVLASDTSQDSSSPESLTVSAPGCHVS